MKNDERGTFDYPTHNGHERNAYTSMLISPETPVQEVFTHELSVVAAHLVEAACKARDGDREATRAHIAHAVALLRGKPSLGPRGIHVLSNPETRVARGGLPAWQTRRVFAHVEANLCGRIHIRELARLLGLSASHFCRAFKCTFGVSPRDYVLRRRIEVAQGLMLTTSEPLSSIAVRCGMCDQPHFTRSFHRIVGETPHTWRRARRGALE
ncbi:MAG TPA: AraC family transcriptional regulator [Steroidobacteraceae bacterium]|jgi:AraC family transcriptional regulator|nr:AraC family transcriptional regulator [Steroidobacteraceae bacterium]